MRGWKGVHWCRWNYWLSNSCLLQLSPVRQPEIDFRLGAKALELASRAQACDLVTVVLSAPCHWRNQGSA